MTSTSAIALSTLQFDLYKSHESLGLETGSHSPCLAALYLRGVYDHAYACVKRS